jgi:acyl carrier protein
MTQTLNFEKIQSLVCHHLGVLPETVTPETEFKKLGASDLDVIELCIAVEKAFRLTLEETTSFACANDILTYISSSKK